MLIQPENINTAERRLRQLSLTEKERLIEQIFQAQPHLLASVLVLKQFNVSPEKMEFAIHVLLLVYLSMLESGGKWPQISERVQDINLNRMTAEIKTAESAGPNAFDEAIITFAKDHPELPLYITVTEHTRGWLAAISAEESDKYVLLCVLNIIECIAHPTPANKASPPRKGRGKNRKQRSRHTTH
jgi:hypothetical protein